MSVSACKRIPFPSPGAPDGPLETSSGEDRTLGDAKLLEGGDEIGEYPSVVTLERLDVLSREGSEMCEVPVAYPGEYRSALRSGDLDRFAFRAVG